MTLLKWVGLAAVLGFLLLVTARWLGKIADLSTKTDARKVFLWRGIFASVVEVEREEENSYRVLLTNGKEYRIGWGEHCDTPLTWLIDAYCIEIHSETKLP